ncbi:hypothetical protein HanPSC8_Chr13g0569751 [Helianthus annuus]|nr:hypothetical protein HanPSC8_Chr13g0569751 [Helianthus annuus]
MEMIFTRRMCLISDSSSEIWFIWKEEMQQVYLGQARFPEYIET